MKKIGIITTGLSKVFADKKCGGGEILLKNLIFRLINNRDIKLFIFTPDEKELTIKIKDNYPNIEFIIYKQSPYSYKYIEELQEIFKQENFDKLINYNMIIPFKTTLLQSHSYMHKLNKVFFLFRPIKRLILREKLLNQQAAFKRAKNDTDYIAVSQLIKDDYRKNFDIPQEKIKVIYPGINVNPVKEVSKRECVTFGIAANSSINKGGHYLLAALGILNMLGYKFKLQIIAPLYKKDILMQFIVTIFCMRNKIIALPFQKDMMDFYDKTDYLILPSLNEAFALVVLEAMERGKPCLVSSTAGCSEIITDDNGFVFNRNCFIDFVKKLIKIIKIYNNDFNKYKELSKSARKTAIEYSWDNFANKVIKIHE